MIPKHEFPRPDRERASWLNLNGEWEFKLLPHGKGEDTPEGFDRKITVPYSWVCPLSGVEEDVPGVGWYRRTVSFKKKGRLFLCFGGVDYIADVYVNGQFAARHQGGYNEFDIDVSDFWRDGENEIVVRAEDERRDTQTSGKQGYGDIQGIWQTVWLENRGESYIESFRFITKISGEVSLSVKARAADGETVTARFDGRSWQAAVKDGEAHMTLALDNPRLWSPEAPNLYEGSLELGSDHVETYFGVREIAARDGRILLNGAPIYINGTLDQAFNPQGHFTYPSDQAMRDEIWRVKRLGLNMARIHIKSEEPRKLYWMDKLGVLAMADIPCFWGEPSEEARAAYEAEWPRTFERDFNHPAIFAWVMFNETWGLFTAQGKGHVYRPETQEWVRGVWQRAKALDPTRLVEDNSPCNRDHVETDINTWHFYINTYEHVRAHLKEVAEKTEKGSAYNYIGGNKQNGAPLMNSECGMVWGVDGSAGDSDIAWQYRYMLNEFRLMDKNNGFVFTELHDVINEFNGYYRIDDADKDFGYGDFCRGMTVRDLHTDEFIALDCPPCRTIEAGSRVSIPCALSHFAREGRKLTAEWALWHDTPYGRVCDMKGKFDVPAAERVGVNPLREIRLTMPDENALAVLSVYLKDGKNVVSRNFTTFDVRAALPDNVTETRVTDDRCEGFDIRWTAINGDKLCLGGAGRVSYVLPVHGEANDLTIVFEAGAKRVLSKDRGAKDDNQELNFMRGYRVDRGAFPNSYWMTDEEREPSLLKIAVNGVEIARRLLDGDRADARGVLSWHYQAEERRLDEAGSYGELVTVHIPSRLIPEIVKKGSLTLTLSADNGLALYGRNAGRYALGLQLIEN